MAKKVRKVFTGEMKDIITEDSGHAKIVDIYIDQDNPEENENGMYVRVQSWCEDKKHEEFSMFEGRKVKITIETVD